MSEYGPILYPPAGVRPAAARQLRVVAVASGKGGTGKTNLVVNLAVAWADRGRRVLVIDGDAALANADVLLDVSPRYHLGDVVSGHAAIEQVLLESRFGVTLLPGASGALELERLDPAAQLALLGALDSLGAAYDAVLIDTAAGLTPNTLFFAGAAEDVVLVTTPEPTALTDTYATLKTLARRAGVTRALLIVNQCASAAVATEVHARLQQLGRRFLDVGVDLAGWLPFDAHLHRAVMNRAPVVHDAPDAPVSRRLRALAERLLGDRPRLDSGDRLRFFWHQLRESGAPRPHLARPPSLMPPDRR